MKRKVNLEIRTKLYSILLDDSYGLCPAPMKAEEALDFLYEYLLGADYILGDSFSVEQGYTAMVSSILSKYSSQFKREVKLMTKNRRSKKTSKIGD